MVSHLAPKTKIMIATNQGTVLCPTKEPGGTKTVMIPILMVCIAMVHIHRMLMASTGVHGKDITTLPRELR